MIIESNDKRVQIYTWIDMVNKRVNIHDAYGQFIPFTFADWEHYVEGPYRLNFKHTDTAYSRIVEIFLGDFRHRYIGKN